MPNSPTRQYYAIVPAAGESRRMGQPKLLLPIGEHTVVEAVLKAWQAAGVQCMVVVCRSNDTELITICERAGAVVVAPTVPPPEMKHSVAAALSEIARRWQPTLADAWLLSPADMPRLSPAVITQLCQAHSADDASILVPTHAGRRGHPLLVPWPYADLVAQLGENEGVNALLQRCPVREIEAGREALAADIDTPEDYRRLR